MIKNIVFDIGGVLADFRIFEFLGEKGFDKAMAKRILRATAMSPYWGAFERGEISEEEAIDGFVATDPGIENEIRTAFGSLEGMLTTSRTTRRRRMTSARSRCRSCPIRTAGSSRLRSG